MPERNLVSQLSMNHWLLLTSVVALLVVETGCSKIGRRGFNDQFTNSSSTQPGSASRYDDHESNLAPTLSSNPDSQPAATSGSHNKQDQYATDDSQSNQGSGAKAHLHDDDDGHYSHTDKRPRLRLSFDDPLELPPVASTDSVPKTPVSTALRNPLTPLEPQLETNQPASPEQAPLQLSATTPIELQPPTEPESPTETETTPPTLLAATSPEPPAKPEMPEGQENEAFVKPQPSTETELAADRFLVEPIQNPTSSQIDKPFEFQPVEKSSRREPLQLATSETASVPPEAPCQDCHDAICDGDCSPKTKLELPVVGVIEETPSIAVAQKTQQPPAAATEFVPTESKMMEFKPQPKSDLEIAVDGSNNFAISSTPAVAPTQIVPDQRSFDDLSDAEWYSIFGTIETAQAETTPANTTSSGDFQPPAANDFQPGGDFQASPIATSVPTETDNSFAPASFDGTAPHNLPEPKSLDLTISNDPIADSVITQLNQTIVNVNTQIANTTSDQLKTDLEINLNMLQVLKKQIAESKNSHRISDTESLHWLMQLQQIQALILEDSQRDLEPAEPPTDNKTQDPNPKQEPPKTIQLNISNCNFCTEVSGFGQFKPFPSTQFSPTQRMLVYCEVENYTSQQTIVDNANTFVTRLEGSYKIFDKDGTVVQQTKYAPLEDISYNQRTDFYMHFPMQLNKLPAGEYRFELTITDLNNNSTATHQQGIPFSVAQ